MPNSPAHSPSISETKVLSRSIKSGEAHIRLSNGKLYVARRYIPAGEGDILRFEGGSVRAYVKNDDSWVEIGKPWVKRVSASIGEDTIEITFKEIETATELRLFDALRKFHYRGGGGAGRTIPLIATSNRWDLPTVLGFVELSSSMIANSARKRFFDFPYQEPNGPRWMSWDRAATKQFSNIICRISRFVIHPEIRGLGFAKLFSDAAREYAGSRWYYGGFKPRFLEITADMLRYYRFVDESFALMGHTEGNEHRLSKDMKYLVGKGLSEQGAKAMPQGGGGIMTLQRAYASQLIKYMSTNKKNLPEVIESLQYDAAKLDQETWESLHRVNRKPKPTYTSGLTPFSKKYVQNRRRILEPPQRKKEEKLRHRPQWAIQDISITGTVNMAQTSEARSLQDAFGFVGSTLVTPIVNGLSFTLTAGEVTLICGASGAGKTMLVDSIHALLENREPQAVRENVRQQVRVEGHVQTAASVGVLEDLPAEAAPLDLRGKASLEDFLTITAKCGLAEPQLFVRPILSLSSGQRYRLQVALAFLKKPEVLIIDNFCEPLDRYTAIAVIKGVKGLSHELNVAVVAATASYERVLDLLDPDQSVLLRRGDDPIVVNRGERIALHKGFHTEPISDSRSKQF
ncbi:ATP-binding cassette domain-containing protein [Rhizobium sp. BE258]|uniref:ATP-binding cassette domain-containing protein n=1 Tax=Rhizobium sp. BE258 TaxID=2817722 RepID=UPI002855D85E|nr:ATP-binding cassette domain-containing protein [Rhizobium sp. BE258]MDR7145561.1 energy-coupling factor transporter ATP-binding protein EcfA2/GNAT superfamily N-acetyltransferase [Rhizobium sp. BE258]